MFWLRGTNVKSNRQQETVRVSAVHVHGLNRMKSLLKFLFFFYFLKICKYPSEHLLQRGEVLSRVQTLIYRIFYFLNVLIKMDVFQT
jgi:hypothetical protein